MPDVKIVVGVVIVAVIIVIALWYYYSGRSEGLDVAWRPRPFISATCRPDQQNINGMCYNVCPTYYAPQNANCVGTCPRNTIDGGVNCSRVSAPRTIGTKICPPTHEYWNNACYKRCPDGGKRVGVATCDHGLFGGVVTKLGDSAIYVAPYGASCPSVGANYHKTALYSCQKGGLVSSDAKVIKTLCVAGQSPLTNSCYQCNAGGLPLSGNCYNPCPSDYVGVNNVCWPKCSGGTFEAGTTCNKIIAPRSYTNPSVCPTSYPLINTNCYSACPTGTFIGGDQTRCVPNMYA